MNEIAVDSVRDGFANASTRHGMVPKDEALTWRRSKHRHTALQHRCPNLLARLRALGYHASIVQHSVDLSGILKPGELFRRIVALGCRLPQQVQLRVPIWGDAVDPRW